MSGITFIEQGPSRQPYDDRHEWLGILFDVEEGAAEIMAAGRVSPLAQALAATLVLERIEQRARAALAALSKGETP